MAVGRHHVGKRRIGERGVGLEAEEYRAILAQFGISDIDAIIPRIGASVSFYGTAVVRQFEMMGVYSLNESVAITRSRDKLRALQLLSRKGIGLPVTGFAAMEFENGYLDGGSVKANYGGLFRHKGNVRATAVAQTTR